mmetsp:Transcript_42628/g.62237  ORF Transcript_42628/g.62237 Transcript_42628/m.62237 type:complete len:365 (+) Transcript_42628:128-1222(+)
MGDVISSFLFQPPSKPTPLDQSKYFFIETAEKHVIPAIFIKANNKMNVPTILYSHGNAEDLGLIYDYLSDISTLLRVNIIAYDYTGYGLRKNDKKPSEESCYHDIDAVYHYLTTVESIPAENIILYGRSVGSGPSCYLAQRISKEIGPENGLGGLILHSPFISVFRIAIDLGFTTNVDIFPNIERIKDISCPILIIHGTKDDIVPFNHGQQLFSSAQDQTNSMSFWADKMGHNNIEMEMPIVFLRKLQTFIRKACKLSKKVHSKDAKTTKQIFATTVSTPKFYNENSPGADAQRHKQTLHDENGFELEYIEIETSPVKRQFPFVLNEDNSASDECIESRQYVVTTSYPSDILDNSTSERIEAEQ